MVSMTAFAIFIYWSWVTKVKPLMDTFEFTTVSLNGFFFCCCWYSYTFHCCGTKFDVYMSFYTLALYVMIIYVLIMCSETLKAHTSMSGSTFFSVWIILKNIPLSVYFVLLIVLHVFVLYQWMQLIMSIIRFPMNSEMVILRSNWCYLLLCTETN